MSLGYNIRTSNKQIPQLVSSGEGESSWSMFQHDSRHTGRSEYNISNNPGDEKWIKFIAQDIYGGMSNWEIHKIYIEKSKNVATNNVLFWRLIGQFPLLQKLLLLIN